jgi:hypothetical protein
MADVCGVDSNSFSYGYRPAPSLYKPRGTPSHPSFKESKSNSSLKSIETQSHPSPSHPSTSHSSVTQSLATSQTTAFPPSPSGLQRLVSQIKPVLDRIRPRIEINVSVELFKQLQAEVKMGGNEDLSGWEGSLYYFPCLLLPELTHLTAWTMMERY